MGNNIGENALEQRVGGKEREKRVERRESREERDREEKR